MSADAVASGLAYRVVSVGDRSPTDAAQFEGSTHFTIDKAGTTSIVCGSGVRMDDSVRFQEKDTGSGKDVRMWQVRREPDGRWVAGTISTY